MGEVTAALDDLHDVTWSADLPPNDNETGITVFMLETPLWAYPLAAAVIIGPWLTASLAGWARFSTTGDEGLRLSTDFEGAQATLLVVAAIVALVASLTIGWWIVAKFKRPVSQATIKATSNASNTATDIAMDGTPDRYIHLAVRRVFDTHDRDLIAKREAEGQFSVTEFLGLGGGGTGSRGKAGGLGALFGGPNEKPSAAPPTSTEDGQQAPDGEHVPETPDRD